MIHEYLRKKFTSADKFRDVITGNEEWNSVYNCGSSVYKSNIMNFH